MTGFVVRDIRLPGWFWARSELIDVYGPQIGAYGIAVYCVLAKCADNHTQEAYPGIEYIARLVGCSTRQVQRKLQQMEELGLIAIKSTKTSTGASGPNHYWLLSIQDAGDAPYPEPQSPNNDCQSHELDPINYTWVQVLAELKLQTTQSVFSAALWGSTLLSLTADRAVIRARDQRALGLLTTSGWTTRITRTLAGVTGQERTVEFVVEETE